MDKKKMELFKRVNRLYRLLRILNCIFFLLGAISISFFLPIFPYGGVKHGLAPVFSFMFALEYPKFFFFFGIGNFIFLIIGLFIQVKLKNKYKDIIMD
ncbi:hypothetical protein [Geosporobacter ferrireducens]|uniref:Uncharacterized protein n=1 Tax=Geosporobacter ferrireducens TaxID=1424294 RepID=A0A1D8GK06_9FIRM|nr:hypothetical protein [Geosporobacter ferrireducens]AOT71240.1 hypothetical protein Gferi_17780 [Geosporobacter ferrireducens]